MKSMCKHVWFDQDTTKVVKHVTCLAQAHQVCKITKKQKTASLPPGVNTGWGKEVHSQMLDNPAKEDLGWKSDATGWMRLENADHKQQAPTLREWLNMPYFDQQKVWVKEGWKKKGPEINTSIVAKPQVQSRMDKDWTKLLGSAADHLMDINVDADLKEIFVPMFWSMGSGATKL